MTQPLVARRRSDAATLLPTHALLAALLLGAPWAAQAEETPDIGLVTQLQVWGTLWDMDEAPQADPATYGDPDHAPGVHVHRARLGLMGERGQVDWRLEVGTGAPFDRLTPTPERFAIIDAYGGVTFELRDARLRLSAGSQKVPFSREALIASRDLLFHERGVGSAWIAPGRDVGLLASFSTDAGLNANLGVYNGNGDLWGDDDIGVMGVARVSLERGDAYRTWSADGEDALGVGVSLLHDEALATRTTSAGADALARFGQVGLLLDLMYSRIAPARVDVAPPEVLQATQRLGASLQASWWQPLATGGIEAGARFALFDDALHRRDAGDVGILHLGLTRRGVLPGLDVGGGYVHRMELGGRAIPNDTVRIWMQVTEQVALAASPPPPRRWSEGFVGTWHGSDDLEGAILALWEQPGMGLVGSFQMNQPKGKVVVGRHYPLDRFSYDPETNLLRVRLDPYGEDTDVVWFELSPAATGELCGLGYEDGRRDDARTGSGGGAWLCWQRDG